MDVVEHDNTAREKNSKKKANKEVDQTIPVHVSSNWLWRVTWGIQDSLQVMKHFIRRVEKNMSFAATHTHWHM